MQFDLFTSAADPMRDECLRQFRESMAQSRKYDAEHAKHLKRASWAENCTRCFFPNAITETSMLRDYRQAFAEHGITATEALK